MTFTEKLLRDLLKPREKLSLAEWAKRNYRLDKTSPISGNFDVAMVPWIEAILEDWRDPEVTSIFVSIGLQLVKSTAGGVCLADAICHNPGPALWFHNDRHQLADWVATRLYDSWQHSPAIAELLPKNKSVETVNFATMPVSFLSAESDTSEAGRPARYVFGDEIKDWTPGKWPTVKKRVSGWYWAGTKTFGFSTPKLRGDDADEAFQEGDQRQLFFDCPVCQREQNYELAQIRWLRSDLADGRMDVAATLATVRMVCKHCGVTLADVASADQEITQRWKLWEPGRWRWRATNPTAARGVRSYGLLPSWANPRVPLVVIVSEFLAAQLAASNGNYKPLQDFTNQRESKTWGDGFTVEKLECTAEYSPAEPWSEERARFVTADVQILGVLFALCWQWSATGEARFVACAKLDGFPGLLEFQQAHKVPARLVFVDIGHEKTTVLMECSRNGWRAMRGEDRESYPWYRKNPKTHKTEVIHRIVSPPILEDPAIGTVMRGKVPKVEVRKFSNLHVKDVLSRMIQKKRLVVPPDVDPEFTKQMRAEHKVKQANGAWRWERIGKRENNYWDCANEQVAAAILAQLVKVEAA